MEKTKQKLNKNGNLDIRDGTIQINQYHMVTYFACALDENLSGETMALEVISKINYRIKFLCKKKKKNCRSFFCRLLCHALIQRHFNHACSAWYPNLNNSLSRRFNQQTILEKIWMS